MTFHFNIYFIISCVIILLCLVSQFATYEYVMKNISNIVEEIASNKIYKLFKKQKRKFYNVDGKISAYAIKEIQDYVNQLNVSCQFYSKDFYFYYKNHRPILKSRIKNLIQMYIKEHSKIKLQHNYNSITPEQFFNLRKTIEGDMVGVYIIYNKNKDMYYVGQATRLFFRVNQHFTGHGNGDVYGDYKRGKDKFTIKLIPLVNSGYYDLDKLEKDLITKYNAYEDGYNKTHGNG